MEDVILAILVCLALAAVRARDLLAATAILGAYSLMMALLWGFMNALDVGFTEAAVGAGISTVLMLAAIERIGQIETGRAPGPLLRPALRTMAARVRRAERARRSHRAARWGAFVVCAAVAGGLFYGMRDMPAVGDPGAPANAHPKVAQHYLTASPNRADGTIGEVGPQNIVTAVLGDYRGYDTMGETVVIFTAALCVVLLLRTGRRRRSDVASESEA